MKLYRRMYADFDLTSWGQRGGERCGCVAVMMVVLMVMGYVVV